MKILIKVSLLSCCKCYLKRLFIKETRNTIAVKLRKKSISFYNLKRLPFLLSIGKLFAEQSLLANSSKSRFASLQFSSRKRANFAQRAMLTGGTRPPPRLTDKSKFESKKQPPRRLLFAVRLFEKVINKITNYFLP